MRKPSRLESLAVLRQLATYYKDLATEHKADIPRHGAYTCGMDACRWAIAILEGKRHPPCVRGCDCMRCDDDAE